MKKLTILIFILLIGLTAWMLLKPSSQEDAIIDEAEDFVYVETDDDLDLKSLMVEAGLIELYESSLQFEPEFELPAVDPNKMFKNEKMIINGDTTDAQNVEETLINRYNTYLELRENEKEKLLAGELFFKWSSQYLYDSFENDIYVSFTVYHSVLAVPGEGSFLLDSYTFNKEGGTLLSNEAVLEMLDSNIEVLIDHIQDDFANNLIEYYQTETQRMLVESETDVLSNNNLYFRIKPENGIFVDEEDVYIILERFVEISGAFESPILYKIPISELTS